MTDDGSTQSTTTWPLPKFRFEVEWGWGTMRFQEVSGLADEEHIIEYRQPLPLKAVVKMPGVTKYGSVTLKRGTVSSNSGFLDFVDSFRKSTPKRQPLTIRLLDERDQVTLAWSLANAWLAKIVTPDFKQYGNEVTIDTLEIEYEGLTIITESAAPAD